MRQDSENLSFVPEPVGKSCAFRHTLCRFKGQSGLLLTFDIILGIKVLEIKQNFLDKYVGGDFLYLQQILFYYYF